MRGAGALRLAQLVDCVMNCQCVQLSKGFGYASDNSQYTFPLHQVFHKPTDCGSHDRVSNVGNMRSSHRATAATVSAELYLDMHHCGLWVTRNVAITPINYSTFDALQHCVK